MAEQCPSDDVLGRYAAGALSDADASAVDTHIGLIGSSTKEHYVHPNGHHMLRPDVKFPQMLRWFDRHLGTPVRAPRAAGDG